MSSDIINQSTVAGSALCGNRSVNNSGTMVANCRQPDYQWRWFDVGSEPKELFKNSVLGLVLVGACLLTIVGNALVLHAVRTERKLQTVRIYYQFSHTHSLHA